MSATVVKLDELKQALDRKRGRTGRCQTRPPRRDRPDFERWAAGVDEPEPASPGRFAWDYAAQLRIAHWLAQWWAPIVILGLCIIGLAVWLG